jgi:hypothetical protein
MKVLKIALCCCESLPSFVIMKVTVYVSNDGLFRVLFLFVYIDIVQSFHLYPM